MHKLILATLAFPALLFSASAMAQETSGMVAVRDPQTGEWRMPTAAELKALRDKSPAIAPEPPPKAEIRADGSRVVRLGERHQIYSVVTRDSNGQPAWHCVQGAPSVSKPVKESQHDTE